MSVTTGNNQVCCSCHATLVLYRIQHNIRAGCSVEEALEAATLHPAQLLGIESDIGTLNFGSRADFILLDDSLCVQETYLGGLCVYSHPDSKW